MFQTSSRKLGWVLLVALLLFLGGPSLRSKEVPSQAAKAAEKEEKGPAVLSAKPLKIEAGDDELHKLLKERYNAAVAELQARCEEVRSGPGSTEKLFDAARKVLRSELAISDKPADRIAVRGKQLELEQAAEKMAIARFKAGKLSDADVAAARYLRLDAAVQLLRAQQKATAAPGK